MTAMVGGVLVLAVGGGHWPEAHSNPAVPQAISCGCHRSNLGARRCWTFAVIAPRCVVPVHWSPPVEAATAQRANTNQVVAGEPDPEVIVADQLPRRQLIDVKYARKTGVAVHPARAKAAHEAAREGPKGGGDAGVGEARDRAV